MSAYIIDGKGLSETILDKLSEKIREKVENAEKAEDAEKTLAVQTARVPVLAVVMVGDNTASGVYVRNICRTGEKIGIHVDVRKMPEDTRAEEVLQCIQDLNRDSSINGIIVQLPLPSGFPVEQIVQSIDPGKDVDGVCTQNVGMLARGEIALQPCTAKGIMRLLQFLEETWKWNDKVSGTDNGTGSGTGSDTGSDTGSGIGSGIGSSADNDTGNGADEGKGVPAEMGVSVNAAGNATGNAAGNAAGEREQTGNSATGDGKRFHLAGEHAVVVGRSNTVGKPVSMLLLQKNCTVTICHSATEDLARYTRDADILVCATGKAKIITADMIKNGAVVIDAGISVSEQGKLCGDVDFENAVHVAGAITPVPRGVGPMTIAMLMENVVEAAWQ